MTDHDDHLLARLRSADPVDPTSLPQPGDPAPQLLLQQAMASSAESVAATATAPSEGERDEVIRFVPPPQVVTARSSRSRGRVLLASAAAAVLVVAGAIAFLPGGATPALAVVQGAAAETAQVGSGRVTSTFDVEQADEDGAITLEAAFSGSDVEVSVASVDTGDATRDDWIDEGEFRIVDGVAYINDGDAWQSMEVGGALGSVFAQYLDPRSVLQTVNQLTEVDEIGPATLDGMDVTQFRGVVDLAGESVASLVAGLDGGVSSVEVEGEATLDMYIDGDGLLRYLEIRGDASEPDKGQVSFTVTTSFDDLGTDISIEPPADAEPFDMNKMLSGASDGD